MFREAGPDDAAGMAAVQAEIFAARGTGPHGDAGWTRARYLDDPGRLACTLAVDATRLVGFQSLKRAQPGNPYGVPAGWGIIGTHIALSAGRRGIGRALFARSRAAAEAAGLATLDAQIGATNSGALAYYDAMGFVTYHSTAEVVCKRCDLGPA